MNEWMNELKGCGGVLRRIERYKEKSMLWYIYRQMHRYLCNEDIGFYRIDGRQSLLCQQRKGSQNIIADLPPVSQCVCMCEWVSECVCMYVCVCVCAHVCVHVCVSRVWAYSSLHVCVCTCVCAYSSLLSQYLPLAGANLRARFRVERFAKHLCSVVDPIEQFNWENNTDSI